MLGLDMEKMMTSLISPFHDVLGEFTVGMSNLLEEVKKTNQLLSTILTELDRMNAPTEPVDGWGDDDSA